MKLIWKGDTKGLNLEPEWEVQSAKVHWVDNFRGGGKSVCVLVVNATKEQVDKLVRDYGRENIKVGLLGLEVLPIVPGEAIWKWDPPRGYENRLRPAAYTGFELV